MKPNTRSKKFKSKSKSGSKKFNFNFKSQSLLPKSKIDSVKSNDVKSQVNPSLLESYLKELISIHGWNDVIEDILYIKQLIIACNGTLATFNRFTSVQTKLNTKNHFRSMFNPKIDLFNVDSFEPLNYKQTFITFDDSLLTIDNIDNDNIRVESRQLRLLTFHNVIQFEKLSKMLTLTHIDYTWSQHVWLSLFPESIEKLDLRTLNNLIALFSDSIRNLISKSTVQEKIIAQNNNDTWINLDTIIQVLLQSSYRKNENGDIVINLNPQQQFQITTTIHDIVEVPDPNDSEKMIKKRIERTKTFNVNQYYYISLLSSGSTEFFSTNDFRMSTPLIQNDSDFKSKHPLEWCINNFEPPHYHEIRIIVYNFIGDYKRSAIILPDPNSRFSVGSSVKDLIVKIHDYILSNSSTVSIKRRLELLIDFFQIVSRNNDIEISNVSDIDQPEDDDEQRAIVRRLSEKQNTLLDTLSMRWLLYYESGQCQFYMNYNGSFKNDVHKFSYNSVDKNEIIHLHTKLDLIAVNNLKDHVVGLNLKFLQPMFKFYCLLNPEPNEQIQPYIIDQYICGPFHNYHLTNSNYNTHLDKSKLDLVLLEDSNQSIVSFTDSIESTLD